ncbi:hypothetical protein ACU6QO_09855 [Aeromonas veronii]|uniref:hypothetical protein n=1 Tax=Aeromonas veronii TaxID=654 RepID=UPI00406D0F0E
MSRAKGKAGGEWPLRVMVSWAFGWLHGEGRIGSCFIPGLSGQKYQDGEIRGLSRGKNGAEGYQGFIKAAVWPDVNPLFLNGFYQK